MHITYRHNQGTTTDAHQHTPLTRLLGQRITTQNNRKRKKRNAPTKRLLRKRLQETTEENLVVNLSTTPLTKPQTKLLPKGLKFVPTPPPTKYTTLYNSYQNFKKRLYTQYHFRDSTSQPHPFKTKSNWIPPTPPNNNLLNYTAHILQDLKSHFYSSNKHPLHKNLNTNEQKALTELEHLTDSIIKPADKGGAIVIWPKKDYLLEAHRQLGNTNFYTKIPQNNIPHLHTEIQSFLDDLKLQQTIDKQTHTFLSPHQPPRTPLFYMNPKIHKPNTPGRPIISGCDSPTEKLSIYIDHFLKPLVPLIPSYIKDTTHFLNTLFAIPTPLPPNTILATLDVTSLNTNIPHAEGIASATEALYNKHTEITHTASPPPQHIFRSILTYILKHNYFEFNSNFYLQTHGTAMGTRTAPSYANIFMADLENKLLDNSPNNLQPLIWKRYIDDIFVVWTHGEESLHTFINHLNTSHPTIKFEHEYSHSNIHFLDTTVTLTQQGTLVTSLYTKPTDRTLLLHNKSHHPIHCKQGVIYSQALRYRRITTQDGEFLNKLDRLRTTLLTRGYKDRDIVKQFNRVMNRTQADILRTHTTKSNTTPKNLPFVIEYHTDLPHINNILNTLWPKMQTDRRLNTLWQKAPFTAYRRGKNLKDRLVRARFR